MASTTGEGLALQPLLGDLDDDGTTELVLVHGTSGAVSVLPNQFDTFERYGDGKAGTGGVVPTLDGLGYTVGGALSTIVIDGGVGGAPALVLIGTGRSPALFPAVQTIFSQLVVGLSGPPGAAGGGSFAATVPMPLDAGFVGVEFTLQAAILDGGAPFNPAPSGFSLTNGLAFTLVK
jgi:hypothetical protein